MAISEGGAGDVEGFDLRGLNAVRTVLGGVSTKTVTRWEQHQGLPLHRLNGRIYARRSEVVMWMNAEMR